MQGKKVLFISNNNTKTRRQYVEKFTRLGIEAREVQYVHVFFVWEFVTTWRRQPSLA